jgi:large subunit ribosomal protein L25
MLSLAVTARDAKESLEALRAKGAVPAVLYGPKEGSTPISFDARTFQKVWREAGETTIVKLTGVGEDKDTLIHDVQFHPVTDVAIHADFLVLEKGKKLTLNIPLEFVGTAPAEKAGHILVKAMHEVEIEVAPAELPKHLDVDVTTLVNLGDHIVASQIKLPPSGVLKTNADEIVASITAVVEEKVEAAPAAEAAAPAAAAATEEKKEA